MVTKNLSGADLRKANLVEADLVEADLSGADLTGADLFGADLSRANLVGANLSRSNLIQATLTRANLSKAGLRGACLSTTCLHKANLSRADLSGADLSEACLKRANLSEADLTGVDLSGADLSGANFKDAKGLASKKEEMQEALRILKILENPENILEMRDWHSCSTSHCLAGWSEPTEEEPGAKASTKVPTLAQYFFATEEEAMAALIRVAMGQESVWGAETPLIRISASRPKRDSNFFDPVVNPSQIW